MARRAIISDLHGNFEATHAVVEDAQHQGVDDIICLGDVVNYGPEPDACLRLTAKFTLTLMGNNEHALIAGAQRFRPSARRALAWTRQRLVEAFGEEDLIARVQRMPMLHRAGPVLYVHGSPRDPLQEYLSHRDVRAAEGRARVEAILADHLEGVRLCFCGHTHTPGLIVETPSGPRGLGGEELPETYQVGRDRLIVITGSVGQPRDHYREAVYVIYDTQANAIMFRRVLYPFEQTAAKALRELFLWEYACKLVGSAPSPENARKLADELMKARHLTENDVAELHYFLRLAEPTTEEE